MKIVFDTKLRRPGCVLLQAAMGGTIGNFTAIFPSDTWLLAPTPDMRTFPVTEDQLSQLSAMAQRAVKTNE